MRYSTFCLIVGVSAKTLLRQQDFLSGTYRITSPGEYVLAEDITFSPNPDAASPYDACWPLSSQLSSNGGSYPDSAYTLGFFAAITVECDGVEIDLNSHRLEQGADHALMQRFFALIELANSPFMPAQGPHHFISSTEFVSASNVYIHGGTLGRSSHHGIHGNDNAKIRIENVEFEDYEVAGIALNGVAGLDVRQCRMQNRHDVPVLGTYSAARFLQRYVDHLQQSDTELRVQGVKLRASDIKAQLKSAVENTFHDVMQTGRIDKAAHPQEYALFANELGVVDGNSYGLLLNKVGVAVLDFPFRPGAPLFEKPSSDVRLHNVHIVRSKSMIREVVALKLGGAAVADSVGSIVQLLNRNPIDNSPLTVSSADPTQAIYVGNAVANAQLFVAKALHEGQFSGSQLDNTRNSIGRAVIEWAESYDTLDQLALEGWQYNGDSMAHVQKGAIGFKIDASVDVVLNDCSVEGLINAGLQGSMARNLHPSVHPASIMPYYNGAHSRGFSFAGSSRVEVKNCVAKDVRSFYGNAIGFDVFTDSIDIDLLNCVASSVRASSYNATGFHLGGQTSYSRLQNYCAEYISAGQHALDVWDEEGVKNVQKNARC
jgi:hypothetical protein